MLFEKNENVKIIVDGMHCNHCKGRVENLLKSLKGIKKFVVSLESASAEISYAASKITPSEIAEAITKLGFPAKEQ